MGAEELHWGCATPAQWAGPPPHGEDAADRRRKKAESSQGASGSASAREPSINMAYRRSDEGTSRQFWSIPRRDWQDANRSERQWTFHTGKAVVTLLRCDKYSELVPYGLMDSEGWVSVKDVVGTPSIAAWGLEREDVRNLARYQGAKKRFDLDERRDKIRAVQGHSL